MCLLLAAVLGCAKTGRPGGGPVDDTAPYVLAHTPGADATDVAVDARVEIRFSELMDQRRTEEAVFVAPEADMRMRWHGTRLQLMLPLMAARTYVVTVGTDARDRHGNRLEHSHTFAFSTGPRLNRGQISGMVFRDHKPAMGAHVWAYDLSLSSQPGRTPPQYRTQTGRQGGYTFARLAAGAYRVIAFDDKDGNRKLGAHEWRAVPAADLRVSEGDTARAGDLCLTAPDLREVELQRLRALDAHKLLLQFSQPVPSAELELNLDDLPVEELYGSVHDSCKVYVRTAQQADGREYHLQSLRVRGCLLVWKGSVRGAGRPDRTRPRLVRQYPAGKLLAADDTLRLIFDEAMDRSRLPRWIRGDSLVTLAGTWYWQGPLTLAFTAHSPLKPGEYRLAVDIRTLRDCAGLAPGDSLAEFRFTVPAAAELASIQGQIPGRGAVTVTASGDGRRWRSRTDATGAFCFADLLPGRYTVYAFADLDGDGYRSVGQLHPFQYSEPYAQWPRTLELGPREHAVLAPRALR